MDFPKQSSQTSAEKKLAKALQQKKIKFYQNQTIEGYEVDFWLPEHRLIIEVDGYSHLSINQQYLDEKKDQKLMDKGFVILRIDNRQIYQNISQCLTEITNIIKNLKNIKEKGTINDGWKEALKNLELIQHPAKKAPQTIEEIFLGSEDPPQ